MVKKTWLIAFIIGLLVVSGCKRTSDYSLLQTQQDISKNTIEVSQTIDYRILPHDRIQVSFYANPEVAYTAMTSGTGGTLSTQTQANGLIVNNEGYIFLPLINQVKVAGLTQGEAAAKITEMYKEYLKLPLVYVEVLNKRVYVIGEVNKPGPVEVDKEKMTLLEAVAYAGDLKDNAIRDNIIIISHDNLNNKMTMRSVDLTKFDSLSIANMMLKPNDIIYVQPDGWKEYRVTADNVTAPFKTISEIASPFVTIKYLSD